MASKMLPIVTIFLLCTVVQVHMAAFASAGGSAFAGTGSLFGSGSLFDQMGMKPLSLMTPMAPIAPLNIDFDDFGSATGGVVQSVQTSSSTSTGGSQQGVSYSKSMTSVNGKTVGEETMVVQDGDNVKVYKSSTP